MRINHTHLFCFLFALCLCSCSPWSKLAKTELLEKEGVREAHVGIRVMDVDKGKLLYDYQAEKYFVPASNVKLMSLYAGMKLLGDSLPAIRYAETKDSIYLQPTGDPSFLHHEFPTQRVANFLRTNNKALVISDGNWEEKEFGYGWSWDDFNSAYMPERSPLPIYGNIIRWSQVNEKSDDEDGSEQTEAFVYSEPEISWKVRFNPQKTDHFSITRDRFDNIFHVSQGKEMLRTIEVPFVTNGVLSALDLLRDSIGKSIVYIPAETARKADKLIFSQPADSLYASMMHKSDNFFAEQTLLMLSDKILGRMNTEKIIDTVLKTYFKGMPQAPIWVDGSGLSRYNQFSPADFVWLLQKMKQEFPQQRLDAILPAGNEGTLWGYYKDIGNSIHAKTGTLSGQIALSGYLKTKKGHNLIFSVIVNNHSGSSGAVRRKMESFLRQFYDKY